MKMSFKGWYESAGAVPVDNCPEYLEWVCGLGRDMRLLTADNRGLYRELFGKPTSTWTGEFRFSVWVREFGGERFVVMSAARKGTCIEMCGVGYDTIRGKVGVILEFAQDLLRQAREYRDGHC